MTEGIDCEDRAMHEEALYDLGERVKTLKCNLRQCEGERDELAKVLQAFLDGFWTYEALFEQWCQRGRWRG